MIRERPLVPRQRASASQGGARPGAVVGRRAREILETWVAPLLVVAGAGPGRTIRLPDATLR